MKLDKGFFWGGGVAACQHEGGFGEGGKGINTHDLLTAGTKDTPRGHTDEIEKGVYYPSHTGNDFYHRYKEDIALMAELGLKSYRLSMDWTRIYPTGEEKTPNPEGLRFYHNVVDELLKYNIEPLVTILHAEVPIHLVRKYNTWMSKDMIDIYLKVAKTLFTEFKGKVKYWLTFNEVNHAVFYDNDDYNEVYAELGSGLNFNKMKNPAQGLATASLNILLASAKAVLLGHEIDPENQIGCTLCFVPQYAATSSAEDNLAALHSLDKDLYLTDVLMKGQYPKYKLHEYEKTGITLDWTEEDRSILRKGIIDFYGMNYYSSGMAAAENRGYKNGFFNGYRNPMLKTNAWGWEDDPIGLRNALIYMDRRYGKPIMITENGIGCDDVLKNGTVEDDYRITYMRKHIEQMEKAIIEDGVTCIGYYMWAPVDLISASTGEMKKRYGVVFVDRYDDQTGTYNRYKKKSFEWYKQLIASQGEIL